MAQQTWHATAMFILKNNFMSFSFFTWDVEYIVALPSRKLELHTHCANMAAPIESQIIRSNTHIPNQYNLMAVLTCDCNFSSQFQYFNIFSFYLDTWWSYREGTFFISTSHPSLEITPWSPRDVMSWCSDPQLPAAPRWGLFWASYVTYVHHAKLGEGGRWGNR